MSQEFLGFKLEDAGARYIVRMDRRLQGDDLRAELYFLFEKIAKRAERFVRDYTFKGGVLKYRTGDLSRAMLGSAAMVNRVPTFRVGVSRGRALRYAEIQDKGGEIFPKKGQYLSVPARGGPAVTPARGIHKYDGPRDFTASTGQKLVFIRARGSNPDVGGILFRDIDLRRAKKNGVSLRDIQAVYILMSRVEIPATHYLRDGMMLFLPQVIDQIERFFDKWYGDVNG